MNRPTSNAITVVVLGCCSLVANAGPEGADRARIALWDERVPFPRRDEIAFAPGATDVMVHRAGGDGFNFLHDSAIVAHKGTLFAAWYNCPQGEMVGTSIIRARRSRDGGRTWSNVEVIAADREERNIMYVPVALFSHRETLYAFVTHMKGGPDLVHACEAFVLDEQSSTWVSRGIIAGPFIANCPPLPLADGDFLMAGRMAESPGQKPTIPAVAISRGDALTQPWRLVPLTAADAWKSDPRVVYPETTVIVEQDKLTAVVRRERDSSLLFFSDDQGRSWSGPHEHNFPMESAKIHAGTLSTGQRYVLCNLPGGRVRRDMLVLAVSRPGEKTYSKLWKIRDGHSENLRAGPEWSYPSAIEHDGRLWVVYTSEKHHCVMTHIPVKLLEKGAPPFDSR